MKPTFFFFLFFIAYNFNYAQQNSITVADINQYNSAIKNAVPGTTIILKNGIWKDVHFKAYGKGQKENPIVIKAEKAGQVIITGDSKLQIYGEYIIVQGLWFKDGTPTSKSIIEFKKNSKEFANNCRFTHNTISYFNPEQRTGLKTHWVDLWGKNNRVDHNNFTGKTDDGTTLVVWLKGEEHTENNHSIDANFFGPRPELGTNGGETIRIGTSKFSMKSSKTIVENNTFKNCDGEIEIISNKSCDNIYRNNLFLSSQGALTLRHGNNALVENNVFIGNGVDKTGGIRVINEGHIIRNNLMIGLKGTGFRSPLTILNGVPNSPLNRYNQVKNVNIQNNTLINCTTMEFGAGKDSERTLPPIKTIFANNLITNTNETTILNIVDDISGIMFKNNVVETTATVNPSLFRKQSIDWKPLRTLPMATGSNESLLISDYKDINTPKVDINGSERSVLVSGAFNLDNTKYPKALTIKSGPYWQPKIVAPKKNNSVKIISIEPGTGTLAKAIKFASPNSTLHLKDGIYFMEKEHKINKNINIVGSENSIIQASKKSKPFKSFFKINSNVKLTVKNLNFDGKINDMKYAIISPSENSIDIYDLFVDNCSFNNFKNPKGSVLRSYANTTADTISIINSSFKDCNRAINFHAKENVIGKTNAKTIILKNTLFKNINEYALKYSVKYLTKGLISDQSLGNLQIENCVFSNINNKEKGKLIVLTDISSVNIKNSVFEKSFKASEVVSLRGRNNQITNCLINGAGEIKIKKGAKENQIYYKNPKWEDSKNFIPSKKSILLKENNKVEDIGLLSTNKSLIN